jgi:hypothetical protein
MRVRVLVSTLALVALAGCGDSSSPRPVTRTEPTSTTVRPSDAQIRAQLALPARVPLRATGSARPADVRIVRQWLDRLRAGHVAAAARLFAVPSRFQNLSSLAIIRSRHDAEAINRSLPCGARLLSAGGAGGFVVYTARLTDRPGGGCGTGTGAQARGAILVRHHRIVEWYRLPDQDSGEGQELPPSGGPTQV